MAKASIPVDLSNPGQVFACLGFLEATDALLGEAQGGFDWRDRENAVFALLAGGQRDPIAAVLEFLSTAEILQYAPLSFVRDAADSDQELSPSTTFPCRKVDSKTLPIRLESPTWAPIELGHWADGSSRKTFKLYAGNRSGYHVAKTMLRGVRGKTRGIDTLWKERGHELTTDPFSVLTPVGGTFNFDPRGAWTSLDAGYSPDQHDHGVASSPVVEFLAAWGLEHARPEIRQRVVRYGVWEGLVPPILARPALAGLNVAVAVRIFRFELATKGRYKAVTLAQEETNS